MTSQVQVSVKDDHPFLAKSLRGRVLLVRHGRWSLGIPTWMGAIQHSMVFWNHLRFLSGQTGRLLNSLSTPRTALMEKSVISSGNHTTARSMLIQSPGLSSLPPPHPYPLIMGILDNVSPFGGESTRSSAHLPCAVGSFSLARWLIGANRGGLFVVNATRWKRLCTNVAWSLSLKSCCDTLLYGLTPRKGSRIRAKSIVVSARDFVPTKV